jgi:hypothetical protein
VLLTLRAFRYVWKLSNINAGEHQNEPDTTAPFPVVPGGVDGPLIPSDADEGQSAVADPLLASLPVVDVSDAADVHESGGESAVVVDSSVVSADEKLQTPTKAPLLLRDRMLSHESIELPAAPPITSAAQPLPPHVAAALERCRLDITTSAEFRAVSQAFAAQIQDDAKMQDDAALCTDTFAEGDEAPNSEGGSVRDTDTDDVLDMSPIAFLAHLGGIKPNTDDNRTPMGRFREIICPVAEIEASLSALDQLT